MSIFTDNKKCIYDNLTFGTHRKEDENGRLIVTDTLITKGCVNEYYGQEIPDFEMLGLEPTKKICRVASSFRIKKGFIIV